MTEAKIYLELSDAIEQLLSENKITIEDIFLAEKIDAEVTYGVLPYQLEEGVRDKKLIPIIASSAAVVSISFAVSTILTTIYNKPYLIEFDEIQEVKDDKGKVILDSQGNPVFKTIKKHELLEPRKEDIYKEMEIVFDKNKGILIKIKTLEDQE
jgi:hypothetical protein